MPNLLFSLSLSLCYFLYFWGSTWFPMSLLTSLPFDTNLLFVVERGSPRRTAFSRRPRPGLTEGRYCFPRLRSGGMVREGIELAWECSKGCHYDDMVYGVYDRIGMQSRTTRHFCCPDPKGQSQQAGTNKKKARMGISGWQGISQVKELVLRVLWFYFHS